MNCAIFEILCLRANGEFSCYCDAGHDIGLGHASAGPEWSARALFAGRGYSLARAMFRRGVAPWGETCARCIAFQPHAPFAHDRPAKRLRQVLFEPSFACALRCPSCPRAELAPTRPEPVFLSIDVWRRVLQTLRDEGYEVGLFLSTGLGDPLTHPRIEDLIEVSREFFPTTPITINTNGNYIFGRVFARGVYPDRLLVSVDGLHQRSYEQYRINGDVATALEFMHAARNVAGQRPAVEWKYILFRHNDSDEELVAAQQRAYELDIDSLQFVFTHTVERSLRYTRENVAQLPIVWRGAYPEATSQLGYHRSEARWLTPNSSDMHKDLPGAGRVRIQVDSCQLWSQRVLLRGWAMGMDGRPPRRLSIQLNGHALGRARIGVVREDVWQAFPALGNRTAGFDAMFALPTGTIVSTATVTVVYDSFAGESFAFSVAVDLSAQDAQSLDANDPRERAGAAVQSRAPIHAPS
jgi:hypothetical protein